MLTLEEARARICADLAPLGGETVELLVGRGRVLHEGVLAVRAVPGFDQSAMDGYAVRARDTRAASAESPVRLPVEGVSAAGELAPSGLEPGRAQRIFTGAPMPAGADAVVIQEDTVREGDLVLMRASAREGQHVRVAGEDVRVGAVVVPAGAVLGPGDLGALAAQGRTQVQVVRRPRVAILPTGDEIREIDAPLRPGEVPNSNAYALAAQVEEAGGVPLRFPAVPDQRDILAARLREAAAAADLVLTCGGVSVGDFDHVREVLGGGGQVDFWKVAMKPGKPVAYGRLHGVPLLGLPGNPVSAYVTFELLGRPALRRLSGHRALLRPRIEVALRAALPGGRTRREFLRAHLVREGEVVWAEPHARQGSAALSSLVEVDALVDVPVGEAPLGAGERLWAWLVRADALA